MDEQYVILTIFSVAALLLLTLIIYRNEYFNTSVKRMFILVLYTISFVSIAELFAVYLELNVMKHFLLRQVTNGIGFMLTPVIPVLIGKSIYQNHTKYINYIYIPLIINALFVSLSPWQIGRAHV